MKPICRQQLDRARRPEAARRRRFVRGGFNSNDDASIPGRKIFTNVLHYNRW